MDAFLVYLQKINKFLNFPKHVHIVLGNESCDLDSTVSALALSYFINITNKDEESIGIPILNVLKEEFKLRTENNFVLKRIGVDIDKLFYKDTINLEDLISKSHVKITLVDHHVLLKSQEYLKPKVVQIIDHRPIDVNAKWCDNVDVNIKLVGSCSTLITDKIFASNSNILSRAVAKILYDTIIFDTIGLKPEAGKVKDLDIQMCKKLEEYLKLENANHAQLFDELWSAHNDVSHLTSKQLLNKDLKIIENILIPGLPMLVKDYLKKSDVLDALNEFCKGKGLNTIILMGLEAKNGVVERDIAFYSLDRNSKLLEFIISKLRNNKELQFVEEDSVIKEVKYFKQNYKPSRKQIIPLIVDVLKELNIENK